MDVFDSQFKETKELSLEDTEKDSEGEEDSSISHSPQKIAVSNLIADRSLQSVNRNMLFMGEAKDLILLLHRFKLDC